MLKHREWDVISESDKAATFGWLCVETGEKKFEFRKSLAATFGWLCVETLLVPAIRQALARQPPSGGCVLKLWK